MMTSPFGSTNSLTPSSQLAQMRLASCANLHVSIDEILAMEEQTINDISMDLFTESNG